MARLNGSVRAISPADTRPLRQQLLRQGVPLDKLVYDGDLDAHTLHVGAFVDGQQVGVATVMRQPPTMSKGTPADHPAPDSPTAWRLRGMATTESVRGSGLGGAMLLACIGHVATQGGTFLWCDARLVALGFYARYGFAVLGEPYTVPTVGPHRFMQRPITPADGDYLALLTND